MQAVESTAKAAIVANETNDLATDPATRTVVAIVSTDWLAWSPNIHRGHAQDR